MLSLSWLKVLLPCLNVASPGHLSIKMDVVIGKEVPPMKAWYRFLFTALRISYSLFAKILDFRVPLTPYTHLFDTLTISIVHCLCS